MKSIVVSGSHLYSVSYQLEEGTNVDELKAALRTELKTMTAKRSAELWFPGADSDSQFDLRRVDAVALLYAEVMKRGFLIGPMTGTKERDREIANLLEATEPRAR